MTRHSTRHAPTNMKNTLKALQDKIIRLKCYSHEPGSEVRGEVTNILAKGLTDYTVRGDPEEAGDEPKEPLEVDDLDAL